MSVGPTLQLDSVSSEAIPSATISGAMSHIKLVPNTFGGVAYAGGCNGGVWKTTNFNVSTTSGASISWIPVTDQQDIKCTSISALSVGKSNTDVVLATCGKPSNYMGYGSELWGAILSTDAGRNWNMLPCGAFCCC